MVEIGSYYLLMAGLLARGDSFQDAGGIRVDVSRVKIYLGIAVQIEDRLGFLKNFFDQNKRLLFYGGFFFNRG